MPGPPPGPDARPTADTTAPREVQRPATSGPALAAGWRRIVRALGTGLLTVSAAAAMEQERSIVSRVRTRQIEPRTIAFIAARDGVGTTTTGIGVALALATLRTDHTVLVDVGTGTPSLGARVADSPAPTMVDLAGEGEDATPLSFRDRMHLVDAPPWGVTADPETLVRALRRLRDDFQFVAADAGTDTGPVAHAALLRADQAVILISSAEDAVGSLRAALGRIEHVNPALLHTAVVAVVGTSGARPRKTVDTLRQGLRIQTGRVVVVPYDPHLGTGRRFDAERLRPGTREAYVTLAALVGAGNRDTTAPLVPVPEAPPTTAFAAPYDVSPSHQPSPLPYGPHHPTVMAPPPMPAPPVPAPPIPAPPVPGLPPVQGPPHVIPGPRPPMPPPPPPPGYTPPPPRTGSPGAY